MSLKPDLICCWPQNADFPLWRKFVADERESFARVIVVFTPHDHRVDYRGWARLAAANVEFIDGMECEGDWRNYAVNLALDHSDAEWVWFTEQDFLPRGPRGWNNIITSLARVQLRGVSAGWQWSGRWHPSCLLARRDAIERTSRYFGPEPVDHFWTFGRELDAIRPFVDLQEWGLRRGETFTHLNGLSRNHQLLDQGRPDEIYEPAEFQRYLRECLALPVTELHPFWRAQAESYLEVSSS